MFLHFAVAAIAASVAAVAAVAVAVRDVLHWRSRVAVAEVARSVWAALAELPDD